MKVALELLIEEDVLKKAIAFAEENGLSLAELVEDYFKTLVSKNKKESLLNIIDRMPRPTTKYPDDFDFKEEYYRERAAKYGF